MAASASQSPYKRRRTRGLIRNLWVYRRLVLAAIVLGLVLWFILINNTPVVVVFPFRLGQVQTSSGVAILLGAVAGSIVTALAGGVVFALRRFGKDGSHPNGNGGGGVAKVPDEKPPSDYAAKTGEGFSDAPWTER